MSLLIRDAIKFNLFFPIQAVPILPGQVVYIYIFLIKFYFYVGGYKQEQRKVKEKPHVLSLLLFPFYFPKYVPF